MGMKKFLCAMLGLLFSISANAACNLFDPGTDYGAVNYNVIRSATGFTATAVNNPSNNARVVFFIPKSRFKPNTTYYFSSTVTGSQRPVSIAVGRAPSSGGDTDGFNYYGNINSANGSFTISDISADRSYISFFYYLYDNPNGTQVNVSDIMITEGSTATPYQPYNPLCETCDGTVVNYTSATGTVTQNGTPTPTNPIEPVFYTQGNMVLRKVSNVADSYDASTGKITRRVGVKVLDGSEDFSVNTNSDVVLDGSTTFWNVGAIPDNRGVSADAEAIGISNYFVAAPASSGRDNPKISDSFSVGSNAHTAHTLWIRMNGELSAAEFKSWLAAQKAAGTPVIIYYPLGTEVVEDAPSSYCQQNIRVATTKYVESEFSALNTALANAVATVNTVVTQTIAQAASIATLQSGKQTRPADNAECPAYKQCLLVEDENGTPHWYEITDPFRDFVAPIIANNVAPASTTNSSGFTQLEYIQSTGTQYIDTGIIRAKFVHDIAFTVKNTINLMGNDASSGNYWGQSRTDIDGFEVGTKHIDTTSTARQNVIFNNLDNYSLLTANNETVSVTNSIGNGMTYFVFAINGVTSTYISSAKLWGLKAYDAENALIANFIPAKRNSDSAIGMYDTVSKTFFANAGSGTFTAGPTVANTDVPANGTWSWTWTANASNGVAAGTVYGEALCNAVTGTASTAATSTQTSSANWSNSGANCWCKMSGLTVGEEYNAAPSSISWVFGRTNDSASDCAISCAYYCSDGVRDNASFRSAVFGM